MSALRPAPLPADLRRLLGMSAVGHAVLLVAVILAGAFSRAMAPPPPQTFIPTKLVKLGDKRPPDLLPRIEAQRAPNPKPTVKIAAPTPNAPTTSARPQQPVAALERAKETAKVSSALDRLKRVSNDTPPDEGDPDGVAEGEVSDVRMAILGNKFATEIYKCMKQHFAVEGADRARVKGRVATIVVRVQPDGKLFGQKILKASGLAALDRAVDRAVVKCGKVSRPPDELRKALQEEGIEIQFEP